MPAIPRSRTQHSDIHLRGSPADWNSWTAEQQGGVLAASLLVFLFFVGLGIYFWQKRRNKKAARKRRKSKKRKYKVRKSTKRRHERPSSSEQPGRPRRHRSRKQDIKGKAVDRGIHFDETQEKQAQDIEEESGERKNIDIVAERRARRRASRRKSVPRPSKNREPEGEDQTDKAEAAINDDEDPPLEAGQPSSNRAKGSAVAGPSGVSHDG